MAKKAAEALPEGGMVYLRYTTDGQDSYITEHSCWDRKRFVTAQFDAAADVSKTPGAAKIKVEQVTEADYNAYRSQGRRAHG